MRAQNEIQQMFDDMGLGTEEQRATYSFSYSGLERDVLALIDHDVFDTRTEEIEEQNDAKLD